MSFNTRFSAMSIVPGRKRQRSVTFSPNDKVRLIEARSLESKAASAENKAKRAAKYRAVRAAAAQYDPPETLQKNYETERNTRLNDDEEASKIGRRIRKKHTSEDTSRAEPDRLSSAKKPVSRDPPVREGTKRLRKTVIDKYGEEQHYYCDVPITTRGKPTSSSRPQTQDTTHKSSEKSRPRSSSASAPKSQAPPGTHTLGSAHCPSERPSSSQGKSTKKKPLVEIKGSSDGKSVTVNGVRFRVEAVY